MDNIYQRYEKKSKQYLNIKDVNLKAETICELIKAIYFIDKNPLPIAILTDESKVSWWTGFIIRKVPYLTVLALQGSQAYISKLAQVYL
jgi:hypothetical protein